jgi:hypothetical protein
LKGCSLLITQGKKLFSNVFEFEVQNSFPIDAEEQQQIIGDSTLSNAERPVDAEAEPKRIIRDPAIFSAISSFFQAEH